MESKIELGETTISTPIDQADTMAQTTAALKEYIKTLFPGVYTFSMIGHPETLSRVLPDLVFHVTDDRKIKTSLLSFVNDGGVEITVRIVSYINFKIGNLHLEPLKNGRLYEYEPIKYSLYDYSEYKDNEFTKVVKSANSTTKEELVEMIKKTVLMYDLEKEDIGLLIIGPPAELAKVFPSAEFTSVQGLLFKFMITTIEGIQTQCIAYKDDEPVRVIFFKRQNA